MGMGGEYREIVAGERTVHTESMDGHSGDSVVTVVLIEENGRTTLSATVEYDSQQTRDAVVEVGMEHGAAETYDRLADLLPSLG